jgi:hypothetical protein
MGRECSGTQAHRRIAYPVNRLIRKQTVYFAESNDFCQPSLLNEKNGYSRVLFLLPLFLLPEIDTSVSHI